VSTLLASLLLFGTVWPASGALFPVLREQDEGVVPGGPVLQIVDAAEWEKRVAEMKQWMADYAEWTRWIEKWRNRPEYGWNGLRERRPRPDPPAWLIEDCAVIVDATGVLAEACAMLAEWRTDYSTALLTEQKVKSRAQSERPARTSWWEHIHLDMLWPMMQSGSSVYGVVGVHATFDVTGRFQMFAAPGAILVNLPGSGNSRDWQPATDWGIAYRLADFTFPGTRRLARLHFNFAKAWVIAGEQSGFKSSINLAGFSVTFRKPRQ
jgi:hypothetical protein